VEYVYEISRDCLNFFFRNSLSNQVNIVRNTNNVVFARQLFIDLTTMRFVDANGAFASLVI
jgi:hypothetical protein